MRYRYGLDTYFYTLRTLKYFYFIHPPQFVRTISDSHRRYHGTYYHIISVPAILYIIMCVLYLKQLHIICGVP